MRKVVFAKVVCVLSVDSPAGFMKQKAPYARLRAMHTGCMEGL